MPTSLKELLAKHKIAQATAAATSSNIPSISSLSVLAKLAAGEHNPPNKNTPDNHHYNRPPQQAPDNPPREEHPQGTNFEAHQITDKHGNVITLNDKQWQAVELALEGKSFCLIGPAGTGKTTTMKAVFQALFNAGKLPQMGGHGHSYLPDNAPGVSISAFTRRATNNIRKNVSEDLAANCVTIHKLLEYQPVFYEEWSEEKQKDVKRMEFLPSRNSENPLPPELVCIAIEEGSMVGVPLYKEVSAALPHPHQELFLGDIQQLPPVFGQAILGYKMIELPVVELTEVYRQALESPILRLAHRILSGVPIPKSEFQEWNVPGQLTIHPWKKRIAADTATRTLAKFFCGFTDDTGVFHAGAYQRGKYNPESDAILIPFNKSCGTDELNKYIADTIAKHEDKLVWEVVHGFKKSYYSMGDKVLYDREDAIIKNIYPNPTYSGASPQNESKSMNYWGNKKKDGASTEVGTDDDDVDFILAQVALGGSGDDEDRVRACSHCVELQLLDSERTITINQAGQFNNLILGYAITVHKSQGSEWDKVFLCLHQSHATMLQRELLYTAVTRAKKELFIICEDDAFEKGIKSQRIKGNTLAEKAEYFKGKIESGELQS